MELQSDRKRMEVPYLLFIYDTCVIRGATRTNTGRDGYLTTSHTDASVATHATQSL